MDGEIRIQENYLTLIKICSLDDCLLFNEVEEKKSNKLTQGK